MNQFLVANNTVQRMLVDYFFQILVHFTQSFACQCLTDNRNSDCSLRANAAKGERSPQVPLAFIPLNVSRYHTRRNREVLVRANRSIVPSTNQCNPSVSVYNTDHVVSL